MSEEGIVSIRWPDVTALHHPLVGIHATRPSTDQNNSWIVTNSTLSLLESIEPLWIILYWVTQESIPSELLLKWLNLRIDSWKRHILEICEVLTDWSIQGVGSIKDIRVCLKVSFSASCLSSGRLGASEVVGSIKDVGRAS